ncbi:hypothetical protein C1E24_15085 [Pseudoalteromonas phenolica]|uniref:Uncharacterized protein n=1 Tax=Pseudoalteromonas phenolica TaxID=161398 RepID=A0A5R9PYV8_9GAMM|nr:hypothetical protein [Pseudoalteromonas phenolica]TLX46090.1 hypothetical protein C1E24_15085 [Pseudoalteromonas phenolica]
MAIPWLIGAAVVGAVAAVLSDDDSSSSSSSSSGSRELDRKRERAEEERKEKLVKAKREQAERQVAMQNRAHVNRFINKYSLLISADSLIAASKNSNLEVTAIQAFHTSKKSSKRARQIEQISKQLDEMNRLENDLMNL